MLLGSAQDSAESIPLASTGVIGKRIPMDILRSGIPSWLQLSRKQGLTQLHKHHHDLVTKSIAETGDRPVRLVEFVKALA